MCGQPVFALKLLDNPRAAADGVACTVIPAANATIVTSTRTRRSIATIRSRYAGHPEISTVRSWLLDGGPQMNDGFGTRTAVRFPWTQSPLSAQARRPDASRRRAGIHPPGPVGISRAEVGLRSSSGIPHLKPTLGRG